jgi:hypothetical protein
MDDVTNSRAADVVRAHELMRCLPPEHQDQLCDILRRWITGLSPEQAAATRNRNQSKPVTHASRGKAQWGGLAPASPRKAPSRQRMELSRARTPHRS